MRFLLSFDAHKPFSLTNGASVRMSGTIVASPGAGQAQELQVDSLEILGECNPDVSLWYLTLDPPVCSRSPLGIPDPETILDVGIPPRPCPPASPDRRKCSHAPPPQFACQLSPRLLRGTFHTPAKTLCSPHPATHQKATQKHDFCYAHTPILTSSDCEGAGETFCVTPSSASQSQTSSSPESASPDSHTEFFSKPAYLTVSSQLHLEALASSLARVYTLSPCFRAERSQTNRHLAEFWMLEAEWAWTKEVGDVCGLVEACVKDALHSGRDERALLARGIAGQEERINNLETAATSEPWARMTYTEAISELEKYHTSTASRARPFTFEPKWGHGLQSEHEKWLSEVLVKGPVFVTDYPSTMKPFYMRRNNDERTVACFDLLVPFVGELVGGSLREERLEPLQQRMTSHGLDPTGEEYSWYVDLRRYGSAPHGGFGMGFERLVSWVSGIENVRECIAMPRWAKRMLL